MRLGHHATASPLGLGKAWSMVMLGVPLPVAIACGALVVFSSTWNDLDHPRFKGRMHPGAALVRGSGHLGYMIRTEKDKHRDDVHRGPSHCIEWCLLAGLVVVLLTSQIPPIAPWCWWWGAAVFVGTTSHIIADCPTPSGVPFSAVYNYLRHKEVWKRHSLHWFSTDSAGEKFLAVPVMFLLTAIMAMGMVGWLSPVMGWLMGWG
jgi:membrane-bound metal-dependent hydrolase YbcI (DUF457 family)